MFATIFIFSTLVLSIIALIVLIIFAIPMFYGAPWVPTPHGKVQRMLRLVDAKAGETMIDLGSGSGSLLIVAAKEFGMYSIGYEINPLLRLVTRVKARLAGVSSLVDVHGDNFFVSPLPPVDIVCCYLLDTTIKRLEPKLTRELPAGTRFVSRDFPIWAWPTWRKDETLYAYLAPGQEGRV